MQLLVLNRVGMAETWRESGIHLHWRVEGPGNGESLGIKCGLVRRVCPGGEGRLKLIEDETHAKIGAIVSWEISRTILVEARVRFCTLPYDCLTTAYTCTNVQEVSQ